MDLLYILMFLLPLLAQIYVSSTYQKYNKIKNRCNLTGYDMAKMILERNGLGNLYIVETKGTMTDHYDPKRKIVKLSTDVYNENAVSSIAIAAHECGHAIQDKEGYTFLKIRSSIYPIVNSATKIAYVVLIIGALLEYYDLIMAGILLVGTSLVFQLVTLPVEINASRRALIEMEKCGILKEDTDGVKVMLKSAALTYVAAVLSSALEVFRLLMIFGRRRD